MTARNNQLKEPWKDLAAFIGKMIADRWFQIEKSTRDTLSERTNVEPTGQTKKLTENSTKTTNKQPPDHTPKSVR